MERSLSTHNPREKRGCEAKDHRESSVKKWHVISRVMKITPDIRHLGSVSREGSNKRSGAPPLMASKSDFHFNRT
jgi:hypothetical protein